MKPASILGIVRSLVSTSGLTGQFHSGAYSVAKSRSFASKSAACKRFQMLGQSLAFKVVKG